jgi:hypothetical protein
MIINSIISSGEAYPLHTDYFGGEDLGMTLRINCVPISGGKVDCP